MPLRVAGILRLGERRPSGLILVGSGGAGVPAPTNTVAPAITGTATTGSTLTCSTGTWTGSPSSYAYQWKRNGANIGGATASTYVLQVADEGTAVKCTVTATNGSGSTAADSNTVNPTAGGSTYSATVLTDSPFGYWRLGEASASPAFNNAIDSSGNARHATYGDGTDAALIPTVGVAGALLSESNTAATFAPNQRVWLPDLSLVEVGDCTYECWIKSTSTATSTYVMGEGNTGNNNPFAYIRWDNGQIVAFIRDINNVSLTVTTAGTYKDGNWHHVVVTFTGTGSSAVASIYVDGSFVTSGTQSNAAYVRPAVNVASIGDFKRSADSNYFTGSVDECAVYAGALSAGRIAAHYAAR